MRIEIDSTGCNVMSVVVTIMLDAFRGDYGNDFFSTIFGRGLRGFLTPSFGFEPDAAYFSGAFPDEADGGVHYWFDPEGSPFRFTREFPNWLDHLPEKTELVLRRAVRKIAERQIGNRVRLSTEGIPFKYLHYFDITAQKLPFDRGFVSRPTVFDLLRQNGKSWLFHSIPLHRVNSGSVTKRVRDELYPPCDFAFLHIGDLDKVGHEYGPDSKVLKEALMKVSHSIEEIYKVLEARFEETHWVIFGDHGMTEVKQRLDIWSELKKLGLTVGEDYVFFLDSVIARFWFFKRQNQQQVVDLLENLEGGHILTEEEKVSYHINYPHNKFGELIFLADPGVLIFPNFFQNRRPVKGMHGYAPEFGDQQSAFLIYSPYVEAPKVFREPVSMRRLFPTILALLGIDIPSTCEVQSLL